MELNTPDIKKALLILVIIICMDLVWFTIASKAKIYPESSTKNVQLGYAAIAYIPLALFLSCAPENGEEAMIFGASVGAVTYMVFNGTELSIREDWRKYPRSAICDITWGVIVCSVSSGIASCI